MLYLIVPAVALLINFIVNQELLLKKQGADEIPAFKSYRLFLFSLILFFVIDITWGAFDIAKVAMGGYISTAFYFVAMGFSVLTWAKYVVDYLEEKNIFNRILMFTGNIIFAAGFILVIINFFTPIMFLYEGDDYTVKVARYGFLFAQMMMYIITSIYVLVMNRNCSNVIKQRHYTIASFGIVMTIAIFLQIYFPLAPFYASGCLVGECLIHVYVVASEKEEHKIKVIQQQKEIGSAMKLAHTDPLTGANNKHAYVELEDEYDVLIRDKQIKEFSLVVFDLNDLKKVNDTKGHDEGDKYIVNSFELIKKHFPGSPIYRYGGDEFVVILEKEKYINRYKLLREFNHEVEDNLGSDRPIVAAGLSDFIMKTDNTLRAVFSRADERMYSRKKMLKEMNYSN